MGLIYSGLDNHTVKRTSGELGVLSYTMPCGKYCKILIENNLSVNCLER